MNDDPDSSSSSPPDIEIAVDVAAAAWLEALADADALVRRAARAALASVPEETQPRGPAEVSLVLADDAVVQRLNRDYRGRDAPTNVLSFATSDDAEAAPGGPVLLGDVVLAFETIRREAAEQGKPLPDHASHLVVHGVLHLLGYDHQAATEAQDMERIEVAALRRLGIPDPYSEHTPTEPAAAGA